MKKTITLIPLFLLLHATFGAPQGIPRYLALGKAMLKALEAFSSKFGTPTLLGVVPRSFWYSGSGAWLSPFLVARLLRIQQDPQDNMVTGALG